MAKINAKTEQPFVSVIIPFYNNQDEVIRIEEELRNQTYPSDKTELIFIDNGSEKPFSFPDSFLSRNILLEESKHLKSPYSARNRGIEQSKGEVIAFIDANSTPEANWLEEGISCLLTSKADLAGGKVLFDFQDQITGAKIVDALTSINMERSIKERGAAFTANLFVKKNVFNEMGLFEEGVRSGGDVRWTLKAKENGYSISYCDQAVIRKFARPADKLYQKRIRTGRGYYYTWREEPERRIWFYNLLRSLKPPSFSKIRSLNSDRYQAGFDDYLMGIWFHLYASGIVEQLSFINEYFQSKIFMNSRNE
ncbi:glycosyltransferase [Rhodohalobacter sulfatireducens]|uniref:Glycosyltransferase n=1 Tax=Rhodohalobacter sulfatireducens TaxID=2911366 RepID=A0ABS9KHX6_9BACT|nr:glycosyltransferase [Rhodohalobacter sulfatireducens]MCG2590430.1 glycosyltransferase [Rhodohalobacter sulfatireducens]